MRSNTRNTIIKTASKLFYDKGYNLTGINEIIADSEIAKATLYSHFKSKEELFIVYLDAKDAELLNTLRTYCESKTKGKKRLVAVLEFLIEFFNQDNFNGCWCIRSVAEIPKENKTIRNKIRANKEKLRSYLAELVSENQAQLTPKKQEKLTNELYLLYEVSVTESHIHNSEWPINSAISLLKDRLKSL